MEGDPKENAKRVRALGLEVLSLGAAVANGKGPDAKELIKNAKLLNVHRVNIGHSCASHYRFADRPNAPDYDEAMKDIEVIAKLATDLKKEGINLTFHNHDAELWTCFNGVPLIWLMATYAEDLKFNPDIGWVKYAGWDPATFIRQLGSRVICMHVKDYIPGDNFEYKPHKTFRVPRYCAPGAGVVDLFATFEAAIETGACEWATIEQDMQYMLTPVESVTAAYYNMKDTGFVV